MAFRRFDLVDRHFDLVSYSLFFSFRSISLSFVRSVQYKELEEWAIGKNWSSFLFQDFEFWVSYLSEEAGARLISQSDLLKSIDRANPMKIEPFKALSGPS